MNLTDWVVGNLKPYKLALNSPTRIGSFLPTIYGCVLPTLTIVPPELFDMVQETMGKNKKAPAKRKAEDEYLLTTKLFCGTCKAFMVGESGTSQSQQVYHYYRCVNSKKKKSCTALHKSIKKVPLENAVINAVMEKITDDAFLEYLADSAIEIQNKESSELPLLRKQLADTEKCITNMLNAIQAGIITDSTKQRLEELEANKKELETNIAIEELQKPMLTKDQILFWLYKFRKLDVTKLESRRRLVDSFVNSIVVYDDYILINFNYKDGAKTVSFKDIESSDLSSLAGPQISAKTYVFSAYLLLLRTFSPKLHFEFHHIGCRRIFSGKFMCASFLCFYNGLLQRRDLQCILALETRHYRP